MKSKIFISNVLFFLLLNLIPIKSFGQCVPNLIKPVLGEEMDNNCDDNSDNLIYS
jgi:hypothetical protein